MGQKFSAGFSRRRTQVFAGARGGRPESLLPITTPPVMYWKPGSGAEGNEGPRGGNAAIR